MDPPSKWTCKDTWTGVDPPISLRKISYLTRGSKRDPSKTAFTWNLCFPEVSGAQLSTLVLLLNLCSQHFLQELQTLLLRGLNQRKSVVLCSAANPRQHGPTQTDGKCGFGRQMKFLKFGSCSTFLQAANGTHYRQ